MNHWRDLQNRFIRSLLSTLYGGLATKGDVLHTFLARHVAHADTPD
jgi:hypothetical protein